MDQKNTRVYRVLVLATFVDSLGFGIVAPILPQLASDNELGALGLGLFTSSYALVRILFAPIASYLISRWGIARCYLGGAGFLAATVIGIPFLSHLIVPLIVLRAIGGAGSVLFQLTASTSAVSIIPASERGKKLSTISAAAFLGDMCGPLLGSSLTGISVFTPFITYAAMLLAASVFVLTVSPTMAIASPPPSGTALQRLSSALGFPKDPLARREYRGVIWANFSLGWNAIGVRVTLIPLLIAALAPLSATGLTGYALSIFALTMVLGLKVGGYLSDRFPLPLVLASALAGGFCVQLMIALTADALLIVFICGLAGLLSGLQNSAQQTSAARLAMSPSGGQAVLAGSSIALDVGLVIGPIVASWLAQQSSAAVSIGASAFLYLIAVGIVISMPRVSRFASKSE